VQITILSNIAATNKKWIVSNANRVVSKWVRLTIHFNLPKMKSSVKNVATRFNIQTMIKSEFQIMFTTNLLLIRQFKPITLSKLVILRIQLNLYPTNYATSKISNQQMVNVSGSYGNSLKSTLHQPNTLNYSRSN